MDFQILATDYDGTLARNAAVADSTIDALKRLRQAGKHTILVTGREVRELREIFPGMRLFDLIVAENGALLFNPITEQAKLLCEPASREFVERLQKRNVTPLYVGHAIVSTQEIYQTVVTDTIAELKLPLEIKLNKGSVMVLPKGFNKATGLLAGLHEMGWFPEQTVAVGDGENDIDLLGAAAFGVAVSNAVPDLKAKACLVTEHSHGEGVEELIDRILAGTLAAAPAPAARRS